MTQSTHTPTKALTMTIGEWRLRLAALCRDCVLAAAEEESDCLRLAHALLMQAPESGSWSGNSGEIGSDDQPDLSALLAHLPPMARMEALVGQGALDSVALALLPEEASYLMSRSSGGVWMASVCLPGLEEEMTSEGDSLAMALTSALLAALAQVSAAYGPHAAMATDSPRAGRRETGAHAATYAAGTEESEGWSRGGEAHADACWQRPAGALLN